MRRPRTLTQLYGIVIGLGIAMNFLSVTHFPILFAVDEAWMLNYADTFGETGQLGATIVPNSRAQLAGALYVAAGNGIGSLTGDSPYALRYLAFGVVLSCSDHCMVSDAYWSAMLLACCVRR